MSSLKVNSKDWRILFIVIIGLGLAGFFFLIHETIPAGFVIIIFGTLIFGMIISRDAARNAHPILHAHLSDTHREIILENTGTSAAEKIRVIAAGIEHTWDFPKIEPDATVSITLPALVTMLTVEVTYEGKNGIQKRKVFTVGSPETEQDPFKPTFPLFNWKEKK